MSLLRKTVSAFQFVFDGKVKFRRKLWLLGPLVYLISPIDLIPDPVLGLGIIDDVVLFSFFFNKISEELNQYIKEREQRRKEEDIEGKIIEDVTYDIEDEEDKR